MNKFRFIRKLIASFLVLVLGTSQVALADESALDFAVPDADVVISTPQAPSIHEAAPNASSHQLVHKDNSNSTLNTQHSTLKSNSGVSISPSSLFATKRSPGAIAVGAAEGNLTPSGQTTSIYSGHIDPGNHVVNRGFCSWNKAASLSVAEADRRCLNALQWQSANTQQKLSELGLDPKQHTYALVNGTDLWNQSNSAGPKFSIKYKKALDKGLKGSRALLDARVEAFRNQAGVLDASGLFGICATQPYYKSRLEGVASYTEAWRWQCIALDQGRRIRQVDKALKLNLGGSSTYSDPVPEIVPQRKSVPSPSEVLPDLPASDSSPLSFDPVVVPRNLAPPKVSNETPVAKPKAGNNFSYSQSTIAPDKNPLDFGDSPQNAVPSPPSSIPKDATEALPKSLTPDSSPLNFDNHPEQGSTGVGAGNADSSSGKQKTFPQNPPYEGEQGREGEGNAASSPSPQHPITPPPGKIESWGTDLKRTLGLGEKVADYEVSSPYGMRIHPITGQAQFHAGVDLKTPTNTPLYAIGEPGTLTTLRCAIDPGGGGLVGSMTSPSFPNLQFEALHLSWCKAPTNSFPIKVKAGDVIAGTGSTGFSTGPHLHFQVRDKETGKRIPPTKGFTNWVITGKEPQ